MKKIVYFLIILFTSTVFAQNPTTYYLEIKEGYELGSIQKTTNANQTLTLSMNNQDFADLFNNSNVFSFEIAYPSAQTPGLKRVYKIVVSENFSNENSILQRDEVENFFVIEDEQLIVQDDNIILPNLQQPISSNLPPPFVLPNDYNDPYSGERYTAYDLIKLPLAWTITTGSPNILVGVDDAAWNLDHPDLIGQIDDSHFISSYNGDHGLAVSGKIVAKANNNQFIAGIAYDSKVVFVYTNGGAIDLIEGLLWLSNETDVRVINCSWGIHENSSIKDDLDLAIAEIENLSNPPLIVAIAHNPDTTDYYYPASYDSNIVLGITNVGHRYPIGQSSPPEFWPDSWPDCHLFRPGTGNPSSNNHNDKVDVVAPGILVTNITNNYADYPEGYRIATNTSSTAPYVTGVAALAFSANPSLTASQVQDIIKSTADDIYYIPYNEPFIGQLGTGRINAFRAVKTAKCMEEPTNGIDLAMQNSNLDYFIEPDPNTDMPWRSEDIWVRNQNDGILIKEHQNPEYEPNKPNYVYVRVTNNSCETSTGTESLKLYWAKANTALSWPLHWEGNLTITDPDTGEEILMGDEIATLTIPPLEIGQEAIIEFEWNVPNPEDYQSINENPWHFCLLARIDTPNDPMTFPEGEAITQNVLNNNNIAWKNTTVVDIIPDTPSPIGGVVAIGNYFNAQKAFTLELVQDNNEFGKPIYEEAEVTIEMDDILYSAWAEGGKIEQNIDSTKIFNKRIAAGNNAIFENIILDPNEIGTLYLTFNFLTKELTNKREFTYHLIQRDAVTNEVIGGETFEVRKKPRDSFIADAGSDEVIDKNETITINAGQINEDAVYNWYDPEGNLIYTGTDLTVSPDVTKKYKLEIISTIDGFKDYDEVEITVNPYKLESLIPNPAFQTFTVNYLADGASSAYIMIVNMNTGNSDNFILDVQQSNTTIDISAFIPGLYNIILVCDGEVQNSKTLIKQ